MSDPLSIAVTGLNNSAARIAKVANIIANASLTPENSSPPPASEGDSTPVDGVPLVSSPEPADIAAALVSIISDTALYGANAKVISEVQKNTNALLNIKV